MLLTSCGLNWSSLCVVGRVLGAGRLRAEARNLLMDSSNFSGGMKKFGSCSNRARVGVDFTCC